MTQGGENNGDVWYAESKSVLGPYDTAVRVITHAGADGANGHALPDKWFYNVVQYPFFAEGSSIFLSATLDVGDNEEWTMAPRYDYNNIMYRLDLDSVASYFDGTIKKKGGRAASARKVVRDKATRSTWSTRQARVAARMRKSAAKHHKKKSNT